MKDITAGLNLVPVTLRSLSGRNHGGVAIVLLPSNLLIEGKAKLQWHLQRQQLTLC